MESSIEIGDLVEDTLTGLMGIVVCYSKYLTGCDRIAIQPKVSKSDETKAPDWHHFDVTQAEVISKKSYTLPSKSEKKGGPQPKPTKR